MQNIFEYLISFSDATIKYNLSDSTLRKAVRDKRLVPGVDVQKFGTCWVAKKSVLEKMYGDSKKN